MTDNEEALLEELEKATQSRNYWHEQYRELYDNTRYMRDDAKQKDAELLKAKKTIEEAKKTIEELRDKVEDAEEKADNYNSGHHGYMKRQRDDARRRYAREYSRHARSMRRTDALIEDLNNLDERGLFTFSRGEILRRHDDRVEADSHDPNPKMSREEFDKLPLLWVAESECVAGYKCRNSSKCPHQPYQLDE